MVWSTIWISFILLLARLEISIVKDFLLEPLELFDNGFDWDFRVTRTGEDGYGRQPDVGTTQLDAAIAGTGGPTGDQTLTCSSLVITLQN